MTERKQANRYAVVDLEATSSNHYAKIIQIGIVIVEAGEIVETYATDVNPYEPLESHIRALTGITDQQLAVAPDFGQVAKQVYDLLKDSIFVAHNVSFDANVLAEALFFEGYDLHIPRVDTVELAQLCFPTLEKYSLSHLADVLSLDLEQAHTAIADATATAQLLIKIQEKIRQLPKSTVEQILALSDYLLYESRLVLDEVYWSLSDSLPNDIENVAGLSLRKSFQKQEKPRLSKDFTQNLTLLGLKERPQQQMFAHIFKKRLLEEETSTHFIQAPSGIGKTYGYLLSALAHSSQDILVLVPTIVLQQQIMENEGRRIEEVFHCSIASIHSPRHYIKLDTFWKTLERPDDNRLLNRCKMQLLVWLCETQTGDMNELKQTYRYPAYFDELQHDGYLDEKSLFGEWDFWRRAQRTAQTSRITITNHAYFLEHIQEEVWMQNRLLIIDEAQKLMLTAEESANQTLSISDASALLQSKLDKSHNLLETRLLESCLFEIRHLQQHYQKLGKKALSLTEIESLKRNFEELRDSDFQDWIDVLHQKREYWLEERFIKDKFVMLLRSSPKEMINVASLLPSTTIFCVSATLDISPKVNLANLLGFQEATFDYLPTRQNPCQLLVLPTSLPNLVTMDKKEHARFIYQQIQRLLVLDTPILLLLTSIQLLLDLSQLLEDAEIPHLAQHRHGPDSAIKRRFEKGDVPILLGTGAFWEGVDFAHQEKVIQVIPRLPFDNPQDRFVHKMNRFLESEGKQPFYDYHLPMVMLKLKQAIGRSSRFVDQKSCVVLLDNRLVDKRYGQYIQDFLKAEYQLESVDMSTFVEKVEWFLDKGKTDSTQ